MQTTTLLHITTFIQSPSPGMRDHDVVGLVRSCNPDSYAGM